MPFHAVRQLPEPGGLCAIRSHSAANNRLTLQCRSIPVALHKDRNCFVFAFMGVLGLKELHLNVFLHEEDNPNAIEAERDSRLSIEPYCPGPDSHDETRMWQ